MKPSPRWRRLIAVTAGVAMIVTGCSGGGATTTQVTQSAPAADPSSPQPAPPPSTITDAAAGNVDERRPVILDYSPTVSDIGALAFLASHPALRLIGVTLPGTGESHCGPGVAHTRGALVRLGLPDVPVACGPEDPVTGWNAFPTSWRVQSDEMRLPEAAPNETRTAPELIADLTHDTATPVEIVAVGPLTNVARALQDDPGLADRVAGITIMGGAVDVPGNVFRNEVAEWNIWVDPTAARIVFGSGARVTLVPLDATNDLPTSAVFYAALERAGAAPGVDLVRNVWRARPDWHENSDGFLYFWDELAAVLLVDESIVEFTTARLVVDDDRRENKGWTRRDETGSEVRVATSADRLAFETLFLGTIAGGPVALGYVAPTPEEIEYFEAVAEINARWSAAIDEVIERTASELGLENGFSEADFATVLAAGLPEVFDTVLPAQTSELGMLHPPAALSTAHQGLVDAWGRLLDIRDELTAEFAANLDLAVLEPVFESLDAVCDEVQSQADLRLLGVDLRCSG